MFRQKTKRRLEIRARAFEEISRTLLIIAERLSAGTPLSEIQGVLAEAKGLLSVPKEGCSDGELREWQSHVSKLRERVERSQKTIDYERIYEHLIKNPPSFITPPVSGPVTPPPPAPPRTSSKCRRHPNVILRSYVCSNPSCGYESEKCDECEREREEEIDAHRGAILTELSDFGPGRLPDIAKRRFPTRAGTHCPNCGWPLRPKA